MLPSRHDFCGTRMQQAYPAGGSAKGVFKRFQKRNIAALAHAALKPTPHSCSARACPCLCHLPENTPRGLLRTFALGLVLVWTFRWLFRMHLATSSNASKHLHWLLDRSGLPMPCQRCGPCPLCWTRWSHPSNDLRPEVVLFASVCMCPHPPSLSVHPPPHPHTAHTHACECGGQCSEIQDAKQDEQQQQTNSFRVGEGAAHKTMAYMCTLGISIAVVTASFDSVVSMCIHALCIRKPRDHPGCLGGKMGPNR